MKLHHQPLCYIQTYIQTSLPVANPYDGQRLTPTSINTQLTTSLTNLKRPYADLFYLHAPDHLTPIEESLSEVQKLYKAGLFKEFGLSNYKSWEVNRPILTYFNVYYFSTHYPINVGSRCISHL